MGLPFNDPAAIDRGEGATNPTVNPGAIATTALVPGTDPEDRWEAIRVGLGAFAGRDLDLDDEVYRSASATNHRNRELATLMASHGRIDGDPAVALDLYTRQSSLRVNAADLAVMGATLADVGVNPVTGRRVVDAAACHHTLAVMATAGLYETSGDWLYDVGLPGKSGIGGGIVTEAPGKGGLRTFAPLLDAAGNSVKGVRVARALARRLGLSILVSTPDGS
jgi:glutaminase